MIDTTQNMDEQRLKIKQFLSDSGWKQQALVRLTGYPKQDVSAILLGTHHTQINLLLPYVKPITLTDWTMNKLDNAKLKARKTAMSLNEVDLRKNENK